MFSCPNCSHKADYQPVEAPLTSTFCSHPALRGLLSGHEEAVMCDNCPPDDQKPATVHCKQCDTQLCSSCDESIHSPSMWPAFLWAPFVLCTNEYVPLHFFSLQSQLLAALHHLSCVKQCPSCALCLSSPFVPCPFILQELCRSTPANLLVGQCGQRLASSMVSPSQLCAIMMEACCAVHAACLLKGSTIATHAPPLNIRLQHSQVPWGTVRPPCCRSCWISATAAHPQPLTGRARPQWLSSCARHSARWSWPTARW